MWCVIQVFTGKEEFIRHACVKYIDKSILEDTFIPMAVRRRKYSGVWKDEKCALFPGYVFMITEDPSALHDELRKVVGLTKLLSSDSEFLTLTEAEVELMKRLGGDDHITDVSVGVIVGDKVSVTEGPLIGLEGAIKKIDRHKRQCKVEVDLFGQKTLLTVGLEIISKKDAEVKS